MKLLVGKIRGLLDRAPELNDKEVNNSHKLVLEAFERLSIYIPDKYKYINLIDIVIIKSYGINTWFLDVSGVESSSIRNMVSIIRHINVFDDDNFFFRSIF